MLPGDLDLDDQVVIALEKAAGFRRFPFGRKTAVALDRYLRPVVAARGAAVGLPRLHPHQFRHSLPTPGCWPAATRAT
jgi:integrase